jgi:hypothetical protein
VAPHPRGHECGDCRGGDGEPLIGGSTGPRVLLGRHRESFEALLKVPENIFVK